MQMLSRSPTLHQVFAEDFSEREKSTNVSLRSMEALIYSERYILHCKRIDATLTFYFIKSINHFTGCAFQNSDKCLCGCRVSSSSPTVHRVFAEEVNKETNSTNVCLGWMEALIYSERYVLYLQAHPSDTNIPFHQIYKSLHRASVSKL
ncbi:hypothetical protein CDAR_450821 [Caerostris darwini]|uniref:Uncharacterized protein n=1 Tax=Caerostris darwini TaxID=1538125 RepID=A0AAV4PLU2_9ARAC|nr:hypothetical protein CDAR_450821 [Caerostris darwini]